MLKQVHLHNGSSRHYHLGGWKKQHVDTRDEAYRLKLHPGILGAATLPSTADLRSICSTPEDQGELGSCTANMFAGMVEANEIRQGAGGKAGIVVSPTKAPNITVSGAVIAADGSVSFTTTVGVASPAPNPTPTPAPAPTPPHHLVDVSRLFHYYVTRLLEGTVSEDSGATIRDTLKAGNKYGVLDEKLWPYDVSKFTTKPDTALWTTAASHKVTSYHSIADGDLTTMKTLVSSGFLVGFGFNVYAYFMSQAMAGQGVLRMPQKGEALEGGHAVAIVGYDDNMASPFDDTKGFALIRNSWGVDWGIGGYFWMPYAYLQNSKLSSDFWVIQSSPV